MTADLSDAEIQAGVQRCLEQRQILARQRADLEAERIAVFGKQPVHTDGFGQIVGGLADQPKTSPIGPEERRKLLSMTQEGRDLLASEARVSCHAAFAGSPADPIEPPTATTQAERDHLLSLTDVGRAVLKKRALDRRIAAGVSLPPLR